MIFKQASDTSLCGEGTGARPEGGQGWGGKQGSGKNGRAALALAFGKIGEMARFLAEEILEPLLNLNSGLQPAIGEFMVVVTLGGLSPQQSAGLSTLAVRAVCFLGGD